MKIDLNQTFPRALVLAAILVPSIIASQPVAAHATSLPIAAFSWLPCETCLVVGDLFFFNANASLSQTGSIVLYTWNFGDGTPNVQTTNPGIIHDYISGFPGFWLVTLTVQDSAGSTDTISDLILFSTVPRFTIQPTNPVAGQTVIFNGSSSIAYNPSNPILAYSWSFGDGSTASGKIVTHVYAAPGPYRIILTLQTAQGNPSASTTTKVSGSTPITLVKTIFQGVNVTASGTLTINETAKTLAGSFSVTAINATTGHILFSKAFNIALSFGLTTSVKFVLNIPVTSIALGIDCSVSTATASASCTLTRTPDINRDGVVDIVDFSMVAFAYGSTIGTSRYNAAADLDANGTVDIIDLSIMAFYFGAVVFS